MSLSDQVTAKLVLYISHMLRIVTVKPPVKSSGMQWLSKSREAKSCIEI